MQTKPRPEVRKVDAEALGGLQHPEIIEAEFVEVKPSALNPLGKHEPLALPKKPT